MRIKTPTLAAFLGLSALTLSAQTPALTFGYSDNACTLKSAAVSFKKKADGKVEFLPASADITLYFDYSFTCADGTVFSPRYTTTFEKLATGKHYDPQILGADPQPTAAYKAGTMEIVFAGKFQTYGKYSFTYTDKIWLEAGWNYWKSLSSSQAHPAYIQAWTKPEEAAQALADHQKYIPGNQTIAYPYVKLNPAYPKKADGLDDASTQVPRSMIKVYYNGPKGTKVGPNKNEDAPYFATVYCFPGDGDTDPFNRPLIISDAFDPNDEITAHKIYTNSKTKSLLAHFQKNAAGVPIAGGASPRSAGYDVFLVDYSQGGGNMLINSALFLKVVEWMYGRTPSDIIVGGPSMGGQIARLAMLYSLPQNNTGGADLGARVKGYLGIDSPNQGASISGSLQKAIHSVSIDPQVKTLLAWAPFFGEAQENTAENLWKYMNAPAAHQMLYEHYYPALGKSESGAKIAFYDHLKALGKAGTANGDARGWRKDMALVSVACSNFRKPLTGVDPLASAKKGAIDAKVVVSIAHRDFTAGGPKNSPGWQEMAPGSAGYWYWSPYSKSSKQYMYPWAFTTGGKPLGRWYPNCAVESFYKLPSSASMCAPMQFTLKEHQEAEVFAGTFIPIHSALDLEGFDVMNPPTLSEESIRHYSPFDAVYYQRLEYNFYNGSYTNTDKRYEHIVCDPQLMMNVMAGLQFIEDAPSRKVSHLMPWTAGRGILSLTGPKEWASVPRAMPEMGQPGGMRIANIANSNFAAYSSDSPGRLYSGWFNSDFHPGLALGPGRNNDFIPQALPNGFEKLEDRLPENVMGATMRGKFNLNDFNDDGMDDFLSLGEIGQSSIRVGLSTGNGMALTHVATPNPQFTAWARQPEVRVATGDFNGDYHNDIALVGGRGWNQVQLALGVGNGAFTFKSVNATNLCLAVAKEGAIFMAGYFHGPGARDLAVISGNSIVITSFSAQGIATTETKTLTSPEGWTFGTWAAERGARVVVADFNFDGRSDIALVGVQQFKTIPVAFSNGSGQFTFTNKEVPAFAGAFANKRAKVLPMEVSMDYRADLVAYGVSGWYGLPTAISNGDGSFSFQYSGNAQFADWASNPGVKPLAFPADLKSP